MIAARASLWYVRILVENYKKDKKNKPGTLVVNLSRGCLVVTTVEHPDKDLNYRVRMGIQVLRACINYNATVICFIDKE